MIVEIDNVGFVNKGAELMLYAIIDKVRSKYPDAEFAMSPNSSAPYYKRAELGLLQKAWLWRNGMQLGDLANLIPKKLRSRYGIVTDKEISIVFDAAGFAYGDQWGSGMAKKSAKAYKRWYKNGIKTILLPQAFGPFNNPVLKKNISKIILYSDLVFCRERISFNYLTDVVGNKDKIKIAPDFTNLLDGEIPEHFEKKNNHFCIIPNYRMIDKTSKKIREAYEGFLIDCTQYLIDRKQIPFILVHEGANDLLLANLIKNEVSENIKIIKETNPLKIKGIIGTCKGSIGSRFHGLASALCQGIPSLATGWSHKYEMLFEDYNFKEGVINILSPKLEIHKKLDLIIDDDTSDTIRNKLIKNSDELKIKSENMWETIFKMIDQKE